MTAEPLLELAARLLAKHRLDAVLIGNAAAALADIITSKKAANRPQDRAVLPILRRTLREKG